jgi:2-hydroxy-3-keto-5-methylthiopentenyl-1-phosphate phosphatase
MKTALQIDFDGTVTREDISFLLLDTYAPKIWRKYLDEYKAGKIAVAEFSKKVFALVKEDEKTLTDFILKSEHTKVRPGFNPLLDYCKQNKIRTILVSNGLEFYIKAILKKLGVNALEIHAAENIFSPQGMKVRYTGPDGKEINDGFKESYTDLLKREGYKVIYLGDGSSDIYSARKADYIFAVDGLLEKCREENLNCDTFKDFYDVVEKL